MANETGQEISEPPKGWGDMEELENSGHPRLVELGTLYREIATALVAAGFLAGAAWIASQ